MTDPTTILIIERAVERVILSLFAGVSLILGWNLFKTGVVLRQQGSLEWKSLTVKLLNVGPGVFFALFGTSVLVVLALRPVTLTYKPASENQSDETTKGEVTVSSSNGSINIRRDYIDDDDALAVNTVVQLMGQDTQIVAATPLQKTAVTKAISGLKILRKSAAYERFPEAAPHYEEWEKEITRDSLFLKKLSVSQRSQFESMENFMNSSYVGGPN